MWTHDEISGPWSACEEHGHAFRWDGDPPDVAYDACVDCGTPRED